MVIVNVGLHRGKLGTRGWKTKSVTDVKFYDLTWGELSSRDIFAHAQIQPLLEQGWRVSGWALVRRRR